MSAYILPNVILFVAVAGLLVLLGRRIPEARAEQAKDEALSHGAKLGLWFILKGYVRSFWRFTLEAKGIRSPLGSRFRMNQLLQENRKVLKKTTGSTRVALSKRIAKSVEKASQSTTAPAEEPTDLGAEPVVQVTPIASTYNVISPTITRSPIAPPRVVSSVAVTENDTMAVVKQYLDNKQYFEARKMLEGIGTGFEQNPLYWARLGYAQYHLAGFSEAAKSYEKSIALDSSQPNRYYNLALAYESMGNTTKALASIDKALRLDPGNAKYLETRKGLVA